MDRVSVCCCSSGDTLGDVPVSSFIPQTSSGRVTPVLNGCTDSRFQASNTSLVHSQPSLLAPFQYHSHRTILDHSEHRLILHLRRPANPSIVIQLDPFETLTSTHDPLQSKPISACTTPRSFQSFISESGTLRNKTYSHESEMRSGLGLRA